MLDKEQQMARGEEIIIETHIRKIIIDNIVYGKNDFILLDSKNIADIIICRNILIPRIFLIEVKHYSGRNGRIGFGDGNGSGFQPEILTKRPKYFEDSLIWTFQKENDSRYYILENKDCMKYVMGGNIGKKQNNFQEKLFDSVKPLTENEYLNWIKNWMLKY
jgi:hypothetical protein